MSVDLVYLSWNRLEFTRASFRLLIDNTDWDSVRQLVVYDDGSEDGTREYLDGAIRELEGAVDTHLIHLGHHSPVTVMSHYLGGDPADLFAKIDNDIAVPPGWLGSMLEVIDRHPTLDLLGMEAGMTWLIGRDGRPFDGVYGVTECSHIGGVGLMRSAAFEGKPLEAKGRFGFTQWQHDHQPRRGWITPDLHIPQLDRIPEEPWATLSAAYVEAGWQRHWPSMDPSWGRPYYDWIPEDVWPTST